MTAPYGFGLDVGFVGSRVVLSLRGDVDAAAAPDLARLAGAVIEGGTNQLVVDLAGAEFIDGAVVVVIANVAHVLRPVNGEVVLRSVPGLVARALEATGLVEAVRFESFTGRRLVPGGTRLGAAKDAVNRGAVGVIDLTELSEGSDVTLDGIMAHTISRLVVALVRATVTGADGVSVTLRRHGRVPTIAIAASDVTVPGLDAGQCVTGQVPCMNPSPEGLWSHIADLGEEPRWSGCTRRARELGVQAVLSHPLRANDGRLVGALNMYSWASGAFTLRRQELASVFALQASTVLAVARTAAADRAHVRQFIETLQAQKSSRWLEGCLRNRHGITDADAFTRLRHASRDSRTPLHQLASEVVRSTLPVDGDQRERHSLL